MNSTIIVMLLTTLAAGGEDMTRKILFDFDSATSIDSWRSVNDGVMGGVSTGRIAIEAGAVAHFTGETSLENNGGFASVRTLPAEFNLEGYSGISLRVRGDGRIYRFRLRTDSRFDGIAYQAEFQTPPGEWITVHLPFTDFIPTFRGRSLPEAPALRPGQIMQVGLMVADGKAGRFRLDLDLIAAYRGQGDSDGAPATQG